MTALERATNVCCHQLSLMPRTVCTQKVLRVSKEPAVANGPTEQSGGKHSLARSWRVTLRAGGYKRRQGRRSKGEGPERSAGQRLGLPTGAATGRTHRNSPSLLLEACGTPLWGYNGAQAPAPFSLLKPLSSVTLTEPRPTGQHHVSLGPRSLLVHNFPRRCCILTCTRGNFLP